MLIINNQVQALGTVVAPQLPTYVFHGATAGTARPANAGVVVWVGTATPTNATTSDTWIDTNTASVAGNTPRYVFHGAVAGTARPANVDVVIWVGSVSPTNAVLATDTWNDTSAPTVKGYLPRYVFHGATAGTARPADAEVIIWVGSATPTNAVASTDFWIDTT